MKNIKKLIAIIIFIAIILLFQTKVEAKSYYIDEMNIKATVLNNGDVEVEQILTYSFDGSYNGIYITIPTQYKNKENIISQIKDDIYNVQDVELKSVSQVLSTNQEMKYKKVYYANNGDNRVYTEENEDELYKLKVYSPVNSVNRTFKINYILKNVCVKHNDVGELYYNFIGGEWECDIKKLKIDIVLPNNTQEVKIWGHGPDNGVSKILNKKRVNLEVENVRKGKYVAARVVFDNSNIKNASKISNIDAYDLIYEDEQNIAKVSDAKQQYTKNMGLFALALTAYWIFLLVKYEKDKKYEVINTKDDEMFEKYNPMLAGCLEGNRCLLARDIIAVILNLIDKKNIELKIEPNLNNKDNYRYIISKVPKKEADMDKIETFVYNWIFENYNTVNLADVLEKIPKDKDASYKFKHLNKMVQKELNKKGANIQSVPKYLRIFNVILFIVVIFLSIYHMIFQGGKIEIENVKLMGLIVLYIFTYGIMLIPVIITLLYLPILLIVTIKQGMTKLIQKITGKKIVITSVLIISLFITILVITTLTIPKHNTYIIVDELLICIAMLIMFTDNLMLKNNVNMIEDFSRINGLKDKIEYYSMMEDRDIEQVTLWGKYLAYAVSFGNAKKISKRIKQLNLDDDLLKILDNNTILDYICSDYNFFYRHASLDRKFMKKYEEITGRMIETMGSSGSSRTEEEASQVAEDIHGRRRPRWWRRSFLNKKIH